MDEKIKKVRRMGLRIDTPKLNVLGGPMDSTYLRDRHLGLAKLGDHSGPANRPPAQITLDRGPGSHLGAPAIVKTLPYQPRGGEWITLVLPV